MWNNATRTQPTKDRRSGEDEEEEEEEEEETRGVENGGNPADFYAENNRTGDGTVTAGTGRSDANANFEYETSTSNDSATEQLSWITWFCSLSGHEYYAEVAEEFIEDDFNLTGLPSQVQFYKESLEMILDVEPEEDSMQRVVPDVSIIEPHAETLYGLVHARFVITRQGLQQMLEKYEAGHFGYCPRVYCQRCPVVPCGRYDQPNLEPVRLFCPSCLDIYVPPSSRFANVDGAHFGTTFPHLLFETYPNILPKTSQAPGLKIYQPRVFGFRISEKSKAGPRMQWLRMRPPPEEDNEDPEEEGSGGEEEEEEEEDEEGEEGDISRRTGEEVNEEFHDAMGDVAGNDGAVEGRGRGSPMLEVEDAKNGNANGTEPKGANPLITKITSRPLPPTPTTPPKSKSSVLPLSNSQTIRRDILREVQNLRTDHIASQLEQVLEIVGTDNTPVLLSEQSSSSFPKIELSQLSSSDSINPINQMPLPRSPQPSAEERLQNLSQNLSTSPSSCTTSALLYTPIKTSEEMGIRG